MKTESMENKCIRDRNHKDGDDFGFQMRPKASPGYWLCTLLPLTFLASSHRQPECSFNFEYRMVTIAGIGLCIQSATFFVYVHFMGGFMRRVLFAFVPGLITTCLYSFLMYQSLVVSLFWGVSITLIYQLAYIRVVRALPRSLSFGEASVLIQGIMLFTLNAILKLRLFLEEPVNGNFQKIKAIMLAALFLMLVLCLFVYTIKIFREHIIFYSLLILYAVLVCTIPVTKELPIAEVLNFLTSDLRRIFLIIFYLGLVGLTLSTLSWQMGSSRKATTSIRKIFHILVVFVYLPGMIYQCMLLYLATGVAFAILVILELMRILNTPPFGKYLNDAFSTFCDEKDAGSLALTPFCLLVGCSLPLWINPCPCSLTDTIDGPNLVPLLAGVLSIGIGDTAASVIGVRFGKHKWRESEKSIEGTVAAIVCQGVAIILLSWMDFVTFTTIQVFLTGTAVIITSLVEAFTNQIDNLVLPLIFYCVVCIY